MSQRRKPQDSLLSEDDILLTRTNVPPSNSPSGVGKKFYILIIVINIAIFIVINKFFFKSEKSDDDWTQGRSEFLKDSSLLQTANFPSQSDHTFRTLNINVESSLEGGTGPRGPAAIVVLIPPNMKTSPFPGCFLRKFGSRVNQAHEYQENLLQMNLNTFATAKSVKDIHSDLKSYFDVGGRVVIVEQVEEIQESKHLMVFHSFCDNSQAYQKRASFFFLVRVPQKIYAKYEWKSRNAAAISTEVLNEAWSNVLNEDKRPALIGRVAGSTILLIDGDTCTE